MKFCLAVIASLITSTAFAAGSTTSASNPAIPGDVAGNWSGFYVGGHIGGQWANGTYTPYSTTSGAQLAPAISGSSSSFEGGGQAGYDYMLDSRSLVGVAADLSLLKGSASSNGLVAFNPQLTVNGTIRARAGYAFGNLLAYATGGWVWASGGGSRTQLAGVIGLATPGTVDRENTFKNGFVLGAGLEYAIARNWSLFAEYQYRSFSPFNVTYALAQYTSRYSTNTVNVLQFGVNYRF